MIHIALCMNNNYIMPCGVLLTSIMRTNKDADITVHVISNHITDANKSILLDIIKPQQNKSLLFYAADKRKLQNSPVRKNDYIDISSYYRILLPSVLPENLHKVLYLDCDMLALDTLDTVWQIDISRYLAAVVLDSGFSAISNFNRLDYPYEDGYFNAGFMLINLEKWRQENIQTKTLDYIALHGERCTYHDQDALNYILRTNLYYISPRYNFQIVFCLPLLGLTIDKKYFSLIEEAKRSICILHFNQRIKPWHMEYEWPFKNLYAYFKMQTVWKDTWYSTYSAKLKILYYLQRIKRKLISKPAQKPFLDMTETERALLSRLKNIERQQGE